MISKVSDAPQRSLCKLLFECSFVSSDAAAGGALGFVGETLRDGLTTIFATIVIHLVDLRWFINEN